MSPQAKTIQIFLPQGNPRGIRSAEMTTRTVRVIEVPRIHIKDFLNMPEALQVGLYFLVGSHEIDGKPQLYIGQTGELKRRLDQHNKSKESWDWERAFVMLSTNNTITQTHALYLEYKAIEKASDAERFDLLNNNNGMLPYTPAPLKADCEELFHTLSILISTMGQPIFDSLQVSESTSKTISQKSEDNLQPMKKIFYCKTSHSDAQGYYSDDGFVILKNSLIRKRAFTSLKAWVHKTRNNLIEQKKLVIHDNDYLRFTENHLSSTPSGAAQMVLGRASNGWMEWVDEDGKTLDEVYRQDSETDINLIS